MHRYGRPLAVLVLFALGCGEKVQRCSAEFKGQAFYIVEGGKKGWANPAEICNLIAKAISESSDSTRVDMFGMSADAWATPPTCTCTE